LKSVVLSGHAKLVATERQIDLNWIERAVRTPEWRTADPTWPGAERRFASVPERQNRVLRAVCVESDTEIRVITVFLDRRARRPA
jgi:Domain of unknown function (DUF4258)